MPQPVDNVTFSWLTEESGCVLPRGKDVPAPTPSVRAYLSLWGAGGGVPGLGSLGEWMPSSASGGNDQSFISFRQCQSLQPSIHSGGPAACSSALVGLLSVRAGGRWEATAAPASCYGCSWLFKTFLAVSGKGLDLGTARAASL